MTPREPAAAHGEEPDAEPDAEPVDLHELTQPAVVDTPDDQDDTVAEEDA